MAAGVGVVGAVAFAGGNGMALIPLFRSILLGKYGNIVSFILKLYLGVKDKEEFSQGREQHDKYFRRSIENLRCMIVASEFRDMRTMGVIVAMQYVGCPNGRL